jgi:hypothetical protein
MGTTDLNLSVLKSFGQIKKKFGISQLRTYLKIYEYLQGSLLTKAYQTKPL